MINFKKDSLDQKKEKAYEKLMNILLEEDEYYNGSFFEKSDLSKLLEIVYDSLFNKENNSISIIVDKNPNNSIDITIDTIT